MGLVRSDFHWDHTRVRPISMCADWCLPNGQIPQCGFANCSLLPPSIPRNEQESKNNIVVGCPTTLSCSRSHVVLPASGPIGIGMGIPWTMYMCFDIMAKIRQRFCVACLSSKYLFTSIGEIFQEVRFLRRLFVCSWFFGLLYLLCVCTGG